MFEIDIRELGGEVWAEVMHIQRHDKSHDLAGLDEKQSENRMLCYRGAMTPIP